jgi:ubiquinone biosynthesis protein
MPQSRLRAIRVYAATARVLASYCWLSLQRPLLNPRQYAARLDERHRTNARRIEQAIVAAGGLFIKVGQLISILSNFLPEEFRQGLVRLQDKLPPRPYEEVAARVESELGRSPDAMFAEFERAPIATASLAQVHRARLADGRIVAVKVQHVDIDQTARADLILIRRLLGIVQWVTRVRGLESYYPEICQMIAEELDFTKEASNIEAIAARFAADPTVRCPVVVHAHSTRRVLTTEYIEGTKITDFDALAARGLDRRVLAERIVGAYCRMIFVDGVYHADPHPGNILVATDGAVAFVDFGAVGALSPTMKSGAAAFVSGMIHRDATRIAEAMGTMGFVARDTRAIDVAQRVVEYAQRRFFEQLDGNAWNLGEIQVGVGAHLEMLSDLRKIDVSFRQLTATFQVPQNWVLLERTLLLLVGLCTELDPSWNPMAVIRPYLEDVVLGQDRDWTATIGESLKAMALRAAAIPESLQETLARTNRGEMEIRVPEIAAAARLLYAAAHQLISCILGVTAAVIAYQAFDRGRMTLAVWLLAASVLCLLTLLVSVSRSGRQVR